MADASRRQCIAAASAGLTNRDRLVIRGEDIASAMHQAFQSSFALDPANPLLAAGAVLSAALAGVARETRHVAWQDGLDLLATIGGLKPVCLVARGFADPAWSAALRAVASEAGLCALEAAPWFPAAEAGLLPDWYLTAAARRRAAPVTYLCRDDETRQRIVALSTQGRVTAADEAALLGYPPCCVAQHHRQALGFEQLVIAMIARVARADEAHMSRLVAARIEPLPATDDEWRRYEYLTAIRPSPGTSVNMCDACAADAASPAAILSQRYASLAAHAGYAPRN
jgi:hypothetical protein